MALVLIIVLFPVLVFQQFFLQKKMQYYGWDESEGGYYLLVFLTVFFPLLLVAFLAMYFGYGLGLPDDLALEYAILMGQATSSVLTLVSSRMIPIMSNYSPSASSPQYPDAFSRISDAIGLIASILGIVSFFQNLK